ncbi:MAG: hypothetical protein KDB14_08310 [Planctomycetales bacterium]|nr:hypothetical protein [Planctomycetales bacterium]
MIPIPIGWRAKAMRRCPPWFVWLAPLVLCGAVAAQRPEAPAPANTIRASLSIDAPSNLPPGRWGVVAIHVENDEPEPATMEIVVAFAEAPRREFSRQVWVPGQSRRTCWLPVQAPDTSNGGVAWELRSRYIRINDQGEEIVQRIRSSDTLYETTLLSKSRSRFPCLLILDETKPGTKEVFEGVQRVRVDGGMDPSLPTANGIRPSNPDWLDSLSSLVIGDDIEDSGALESIRRWVRGGGRLWILADRVSEQTIEAIVGDEAALTVVSRETLPQLSFHRDFPTPETTPVADHPNPPAICVVADPPGDVVCEANGYPAACRLQIGDGVVGISMVAVDAWTPRSRAWLSDAIFGGANPVEPLSSEMIKETLYQQVGQRVPARWLVVGVLGLMTLSMVVMGVLFHRQGRLERMLWLVPAVSGIAALVLVLVGQTLRGAAPATLATFQLAQATSGSGAVDLKSYSLLYSPTPINEPIGGVSASLKGSEPPPRIRSTGAGQWSWIGVNQPTGARLYEVHDEASTPLRVEARLTERGVEGKLVGLGASEVKDAVIGALGMPSIAVEWKDEHHFVAGREQTLGLGQHVPSSLMGDEGRRHQQLLSSLWGPKSQRPAGGPELVFWNQLWPESVVWPSTERQRGEALTTLPLRFAPLAPGDKVSIPGSLLRIQTRSSLFSVSQQRWVGSFNGPSRFSLKFMLPSIVLPFKVTGAELVWKLNVPGRAVEVHARGDLEPLQRLENPVGVHRVRIDNQKSLQVDEDGIQLDVEVFASEGRTENARWSLDYALLHVEGVAK